MKRGLLFLLVVAPAIGAERLTVTETDDAITITRGEVPVLPQGGLQAGAQQRAQNVGAQREHKRDAFRQQYARTVERIRRLHSATGSSN